MSFNDLHQKFLEFLHKQGRASATVLAYGKDIEQLLEFLKEHEVQAIDTVSTEHIEDFKESLKRLRYTPKSISRKINSIKTFYRFLTANKLVDGNPAAAITSMQRRIHAKSNLPSSRSYNPQQNSPIRTTFIPALAINSASRCQRSSGFSGVPA